MTAIPFPGKKKKIPGKRKNPDGTDILIFPGLGDIMMTKIFDEQIKQVILERMAEYLEMTGRQPNRYGKYQCPNPTHTDSDPSAIYNKDTHTLFCFGCGRKFDIFDLIGWDYSLPSFPEKIKKAAELFHIELAEERPEPPKKAAQKREAVDYTAYYAQCHARIKGSEAENYLHKRGIGQEVADRFKIGYDPAWRHPAAKKAKPEPRLIIPTGKASYTARAIDEKADKGDRYRKVGASQFFGIDALDQNEPFFVVEGELDALSLWEIGIPAVGVGSKANINRFIDHIKGHLPKAAMILALDNDQEGQKAQQEAGETLQGMGIFFFPAKVEVLYGGKKDANDALKADRDAFQQRAEAVQAEADNKRYEKEAEVKADYIGKNAVSSYIDDFMIRIAEDASRNAPIDTGFSKLNTELDGGIFPGLYFIGAVSSLGKTTLTLQIMDNIAQQGKDVLFFTLEMSRDDLMGKTISRLTYELNGGKNGRLPKTSRGITTGQRYEKYSQEEKELIQAAIDKYAGYADHVFIFEGVGDMTTERIRQIVTQHKDVQGVYPVVIIDYLQIITPADPRATDKANTDKAVLDLKRLSRDFNIPVIAISAFNRGNYDKKANMAAFKESGAIEYASDVLIGLQFPDMDAKDFDPNEAKGKDIREVEAVILKNRHGKCGTGVSFDYYAMFNYFKERVSHGR